MTVEFNFRILGMLVFAVLGARFGVATAAAMNLPEDANGLIFSLVGALAGLITTPWITTRPAQRIRRIIMQSPAEILVTTLVGLIFGLLVASLFAWSLSRLPGEIGQYAPTIMAVVCAYIGVTLFSARAYDIFSLFGSLIRGNLRGLPSVGEAVGLLMDTSVIIDGRVLELSKTGFLSGAIYVPQFVLSELQNIANSSDPLRRQRGRHGLEVLNKLRQEGLNPVQVIDDDPESIEAVDAKLVAVAKERNIPLMTNDFNLNGVAEVQGVRVLNLNDLSLALQPAFLPGERLDIRVISEGSQADQGVGYLRDGTMVVIEGGKNYLDRIVPVTITRYIRSAAGKMYFAVPEVETRAASR